MQVISRTLNKLRLLFLKDKESYSVFYKILGFLPKDIRLYKQALIHKSFSIKDNDGKIINNERLEFLGDAILDAIVADIVFKKFNSKREGFLTSTRSKIVQRETLNKVGDKIGLDKIIKYSHQSLSPSHNNNLSGNAFEAMIGAIYLDRGYNVCKSFMEDKILKEIIDINLVAKKEVNFKSRMIEWTQKKRLDFEYKLVDCPNDGEGNMMFNTELLIEGMSLGQGMGYSKKESQQNASKQALKKILNDKELQEQLVCLHAERILPVQESTDDDEINEEMDSSEVKETVTDSE